jgi:hypothetical protein
MMQDKKSRPPTFLPPALLPNQINMPAGMTHRTNRKTTPLPFHSLTHVAQPYASPVWQQRPTTTRHVCVTHSPTNQPTPLYHPHPAHLCTVHLLSCCVRPCPPYMLPSTVSFSLNCILLQLPQALNPWCCISPFLLHPLNPLLTGMLLPTMSTLPSRVPTDTDFDLFQTKRPLSLTVPCPPPQPLLVPPPPLSLTGMLLPTMSKLPSRV